MEFEKVYSSILKEYPDVMNPEEVAKALGISTKTIYQLLRCNKINHIKLGRTYKIPKIHLLVYLQLFSLDTQ